MKNSFKKGLSVILHNPKRLFVFIIANRIFWWLSDERFIKFVYYCRTGKKLNLDKPETFNEKIQWLKINDHNPEYIEKVDKLMVRSYVSEKIGKEYLIPLIGTYEQVKEINFKKLPNRFVLKNTHDSGGVVICKDKDTLNIKKAKNTLRKRLKKNFYYAGREWPYKNVQPRIICEQYMEDETNSQLKDYKIFCFNGEPKLIQVDYDRFKNHKRNLYDINWNHKNASIEYPNDFSTKIEKPNCLEEMIDVARILSKDYKHIRVDLYVVKNKIYFGELTLYHGSGFETFEPESFGKLVGSWIKLDN